MKITQNVTGRLAAAALCAVVAFSLVPSKGYPENGKAPAFETAKELFSQGYVFFNKMNYLAAAEYFRKALSAYPDYYTAREYLARSYRLAGYSDEALTEWDLLLKEADSPSVQSKVDALRFRDYALPKKSSREYVFSRVFESNELGRYAFPYPSAVAVDSEKNLYVTSFTEGRIVKFDAAGEPEDHKSFSGSKIYGLDCFGDKVAATDFSKNRLFLLSRELKVLKEIGGTGEAPGKFHGPEGVKFDRKGYIYVVDSGNSRVQKFSPDGNFVLSFGRNGVYEGDLAAPTDCAIDGTNVYVTDSGNRRIAVFDDSGNFKENIIVEGLINPKGITCDGTTLVISDEKAGICFYDRSEKAASWFKSWKDESESFSRVHAAVFDRDGFLYALDHGRQSVFVFSSLSSKYTNLDVEIASIDIAKYPLVAFYLNVRSRSGAPVYNLKPSQFEVIEDGAHIRSLSLDYLKDQEPSVSATILLDRSLQAKPFHSKYAWAADLFLKKMHKNDRVKILNVNSDYWTGSNFDWSRLRSLKAVENTTFGEGKKIGKAMYNAIGELAPKLNRRAVIFLTDGSTDSTSFSPYSSRQIMNYASTHFVQVYVISFGAIDPELSRIAESTGGFAVRASDADTLSSLYGRIKSSEEYRYVLVYRSFKTAEFAHWWSDVSIKVDLNGVTGVEWGGYFVPLPKDMPYKPSNLKLPGAQSGAAAGGGGHGGGAAPAAAPPAQPAAGGGGGHGGGH